MPFTIGKPKPKPKPVPTTTTKKTAYTPQSVIPGIPHTIEGSPKYSSVTTQLSRPAGYQYSQLDYLTQGGQGGGSKGRNNEAVTFKPKEDKGVKATLDDFLLKQKLRKNIVSLPDPDDANLASRRRAALRRRGGRAGTMLSNGADMLGAGYRL